MKKWVYKIIGIILFVFGQSIILTTFTLPQSIGIFLVVFGVAFNLVATEEYNKESVK